MSIQRVAANFYISNSSLERDKRGARHLIVETLDRVLEDIEKHIEVGQEIEWPTLDVRIKQDITQSIDAVRINAVVNVWQNDVVSTINVVALGQHEREKRLK